MFKKQALPQRANCRKHIASISHAQRKNPNRPRFESFNWRRVVAFGALHQSVAMRAAHPEWYPFGGNDR